MKQIFLCMVVLLVIVQSTSGVVPSATYQAEDASAKSGCSTQTQWVGHTGTGYIDMGGESSYFEWGSFIDGGTGGSCTLEFTYASSTSRPCEINVNGTVMGSVDCDATGSFSNWLTDSINVTLEGGLNTIRVTAATGNGGPNVDKMDIFVPDEEPPTPYQATWASVPTADSFFAISMTAATGSDPSGVQYYFDETTGNEGGTDSGWIDVPTYTDTDLTPGTTFTYTVTMRDGASTPNVGDPSVAESATTLTDDSPASLSWDDGGADHLWSNSSNWNPDDTPGIITTASIDTGVCQIDSGTTAYCDNLNGPGWHGNCDLEITGGTLEILGNWELIRYEGSSAIISMSGGTVTAPFFRSWHGDLVFDMTGGELNIAGGLEIPRSYTTTGSGVLNLDGGIVRAGSLILSSSAVLSKVDITTGIMILDGDETSAISTYVSDGRMTSYDGRGELIVDYDTTNAGKTTVQSAAFNPDQAYGSSPSDALKNVDANTIITWSAGDSAVSHDIYFGTDFNAVTNGDISMYQGNQPLANNSFNPNPDGELEWNVRCYWRIDEIAADDRVTIGDVWSFVPGRRCILQLLGDYTDDCYVNFDDFVYLVDRWLANDGIVDLDYDGFVDLDDFSAFGNNWQGCNHPDVPSCTDHGVLWDMKSLSRTPNMYPSADDYGASDVYPDIDWHAIFYDGEPWFDQPTRVFAYYALPEGASAQNKVPAIIYVHGGGGTASAYEVRYWVQRGYACLSMDTDGTVPEGTYPDRTRHPWSGPLPFGWDQAPWPDLRDHWNYHAVADVILANSLLRSMPEIDADNIGLKGVSWGGYKVSIAAGIDHRIRFAMPLYGSGFWHEDWAISNPGSITSYTDSEGNHSWLEWWDAGVYLPGAKVPMLWAIGTNDIHFYPPSIFASSQAIQGSATVSLLWEQGHGSAIDEPLAFANSIVKGEPALPTVLDSGLDGDNLWATYSESASAPVVSAELLYTTDSVEWPDRTWNVAAASLDTETKTVTATVPTGTTACYFNLVDDRELRVSSTLIEIP